MNDQTLEALGLLAFRHANGDPKMDAMLKVMNATADACNCPRLTMGMSWQEFALTAAFIALAARGR